MARGTVKTFEPSQGFGTMTLEGGEELPFDISVSNKREIGIGDSAEVTVGTGYTGKPKAKRVVFMTESDRAPAFEAGFIQLQGLGFLEQWTLQRARGALEEVLDDVPSRLLRAEAGELLRVYYGEGLSELGRSEGVIALDSHFDQEHAISDLLAIADGWSVPFRFESGSVVIGDSTKVDLADGLQPLLAALNEELENSGSGGRYFSLDFDGDYSVVVYRAAEIAARLRAATFLKLA